MVQWIRWYKSIYEMLPSEKPEDEIIADDERLDRWFEHYLHELARRSGKKGGDPQYDLTGNANIPQVVRHVG